MQSASVATTETVKEGAKSDAMEDDEQLKLAMSMSVEGAASSSTAGADAAMSGLYDPNFLNTVLSSLPGVDTSDPRVQGVLEGIKKDEKQIDEKKDSEKKE